jgi:hypothetical protein
MKNITNRLVCFIYICIFVQQIDCESPSPSYKKQLKKSTLVQKRGILKSCRIPLFFVNTSHTK